jgi:hypothetical protein
MARKYVEKMAEDQIDSTALSPTEPFAITWEEWTEENFEVFNLPKEAGLLIRSEFYRAMKS